MRILLDECMPRKLKPLLPGHDVRTVAEAGYAGKKNGELLQLAEKAGFEIFLTLDRGIEHQQNLAGRRISLVVLRTKSSRLRDVRLVLDACLTALAAIRQPVFAEIELIRLPAGYFSP
jgi:predicted nuclease of predicted toxin-antitoxin system